MLPQSKTILRGANGTMPSDSLAGELAELGFQVLTARENSGEAWDAAGLVLTDYSDGELLTGNLSGEAGGEPRLLLVYGNRIPNGTADALAATYPEWEVVRLFCFADKERALLGGEEGGIWLRRLSRQLARHGFVSFVTRRCEVDEAVRQLPLYLAWKERFFLRMSEQCDKSGSRSQVVARALGMDKRIGQSWLYTDRKRHGPVYRWITRQLRHIREKAEIQRITLWGRASFWEGFPRGELQGMETRLFSPGEAVTDDFSSRRAWAVYDNWRTALAHSDLLVIGTADPVIQEIRLPELIQGMNQPLILDACSCFPVTEAESCQILYRTIGENTNVWEWNRL
ncbi:hypothetical protein NDK47_00535 [Brevibacillus ruminantium]|uniref:Uncharacterized protein n=1 Tax=Brevibacillus ruminantium TaxID=2950604 RepID=A0ABY4WFE2_9BACL|nr:hypothetical protein [Brevibacillus ruminantium]USG65878.1 hypothetical protein NDK47_00535 [Brevibacillus ruminantium]